jgi:acyl carrier protein
MSRELVREGVRKAIVDSAPQAHEFSERYSFVSNLGYDSLRVATLAVALERHFGRVILLNEWISGIGDPNELTVGSLIDYVHSVLAEEH